MPNKYVDGKSVSDFVKDGALFIPNKYTLNDCQIIEKWNGQVCLKRDMGLLLVENIEKEANTRTIAPMMIQNLEDTFVNKINNFMDHDCESGYPSHLRTPIHAGILTLNKNYNITFTGTNPSKMKFKLFDVSFENIKYNIFKVKYGSPQTVVVFDKNGKEIKSREWKESETMSLNDTSLKCGDSKWSRVINTIEFFITNEENCILTLNTVNSIQLFMRLNITVNDFYSKNSSNQLIYNIAAVLGIPPEQIRITGTLKGSTIVLIEILEKIPSINDSDNLNSKINSDVNSSSMVIDGKLNLNKALITIISSIQNNSIILPAPVLDIKYDILSSAKIDSTNSVSSNNDVNNNNNNSSNTTSSTTSNSGNNNSSGNNPTGFINFTQPSYVPISYNETSNTDNSDNKNPIKYSEEEKRNLIIILSVCIPLLIILIVAILSGVFCFKKKIPKITEFKPDLGGIKNIKINGYNNYENIPSTNDYNSNKILTIPHLKSENNNVKLETSNNLNIGLENKNLVNNKNDIIDEDIAGENKIVEGNNYV